MSRYLIVNADDFGLTAGVSRAIIQAHREGILTSTTFMANFPWAPELAPMLAEAPGLGVGVHLNITTGTPLLPAAEVLSLVNESGQFNRSMLHTLSRADIRHVRREWAAQIERAISLLGRRPTHLDTHRFLQGHPAYAEVMIDLARTYNIAAVRCLYPGSDLPLGQMFSRWNPARLVVNRALSRSADLVLNSGLRCPQRTVAGDFDRELLLRRLDRLQDGVTEMVSHPGVVDDHLRSLTSLLGQRETELAALTAPEVRAKVDERQIQLVSFEHLAS